MSPECSRCAWYSSKLLLVQVDTVITPCYTRTRSHRQVKELTPAHTFSSGEAAANPYRLAPELLLSTTALPWGVAPARCGGISEI